MGAPPRETRLQTLSRDLYGSLAGAVADAGLLCADVRARRGLARAALGRAASAILPAEDGGYLRTAAAVSALFNLAWGRLAEGCDPALIIVGSLKPGEAQERLESGIAPVGHFLARSEEDNRPIANPAGLGRVLAEFLILALRDTGVLWLPDGVPVPGQLLGTSWPDGDLPPTLEEALGRHATGPRDADLAIGVAAGQPRELIWTPSMRWPGRTRV